MNNFSQLDVACVIHGNLYDFCYVEKLYSMLSRNLALPFQFHVLTESTRSVPDHMIRHDLIEWPGIGGRRSAWWYKLQIFDPGNRFQQVLYLDLDTVIVNNLNWIEQCDRDFFWGIRDFRYLWKSNWTLMNSSMMYFDSQKFSYIWQDFQQRDLDTLRRIYPGDQDYLSKVIRPKDLRFFELSKAQSWRWQIFDGGIDIKTRCTKNPGRGALIPPDTSVIVFHGSPKPHEIQEPVMQLHWQ